MGRYLQGEQSANWTALKPYATKEEVLPIVTDKLQLASREELGMIYHFMWGLKGRPLMTDGLDKDGEVVATLNGEEEAL